MKREGISTMNTTLDRVQQLRELDAEHIAEIDGIELGVTREHRLSDAMRRGALVVDQDPNGWGNGERACVLHQEIIGAIADGYIK
jgi:hypothetical protein